MYSLSASFEANDSVSGLVDEDGAISSISMTAFYAAVDAFLTTRKGDVLELAQSIVLATRDVVTEADVREVDGLGKLKTLVSISTNNLITACKNYTTSLGGIPLSTLDAVIMNMTTPILEIAKIVKVRPPIDSSITYTLDDEFRNLKQYLEENTSSLLSNLQSLLSELKDKRENVSLNLENIILDVFQASFSMFSKAEETLRSETGSEFKERAEWTVKDLGECCMRMQTVHEKLMSSNAVVKSGATTIDSDGFVQRLAGVSFDLIKNIKDLIRYVEEVDMLRDNNNMKGMKTNGTQRKPLSGYQKNIL